MARTATYGVGRYLASLKWAGVNPDAQGMFILPKETPALIIQDVETVCAKDDRYDWKFEGEA